MHQEWTDLNNLREKRSGNGKNLIKFEVALEKSLFEVKSFNFWQVATDDQTDLYLVISAPLLRQLHSGHAMVSIPIKTSEIRPFTLLEINNGIEDTSRQ
jgi:hypothetical protein